MWYIKLIVTHYWLTFKLRHLCKEFMPHYVEHGDKRYIDYLFIEAHSLAASNYNSARNIHINTTKDTTLGNHGGY